MLRFSKFQRRMRKEKMIHETQVGENHPSHPYCCRDYMMPDAGVYTAIYNYFYTTGQLNDSNGDEINSVTIKPGPGVGIERGINVDVNMYAFGTDACLGHGPEVARNEIWCANLTDVRKCQFQRGD